MNWSWKALGCLLGVMLLSGNEPSLAAPAKTMEPPRLVVQAGHGFLVGSVAFSPNGKTMVSGSWDNTLKFWDVATGKELRTFTGHRSPVVSVAFSSDGKTVVSGSSDDTLKTWDIATGKELRTFAGHRNFVTSVAFSPDGKTIVSGSGDNTLKLWEVATGKELRTFAGHRYTVDSVAFSTDGKTVVSGSLDKTLKLWDVGTGKELRAFVGHGDQVTSVAFSVDGKAVVSGSWDGSMKLWDIVTGKELRTFAGSGYPVSSVAFSPDGKTMVAGNGGKILELWDVITGTKLRTFTGHGHAVSGVAFSPDGKSVVSASFDKTLKLWDVLTGEELRTFTGYVESVSSVAFSPDGKTLVSAAHDKTPKLWDMATGQELRAFAGHGGWVNSVAFAPDGKTVLSGSSDKTLKLWDPATGAELRTFAGHQNLVTSVAFSPDGKTVMSGSWDNTLRHWDLATGKELRAFAGHGDLVHPNSVAFAPDGKTVVSGSSDNTVKLWNVVGAKELRALSGHGSGQSSVGNLGSGVKSVAFSPDGKTVVLGNTDSTLTFWDVETGREFRVLAGHQMNVMSVAYAPDGKTVLSGSADATLKLWDVVTGKEVRTLAGHGGVVDSVAWSSDGQTVASGSRDKTIKLWRVSDGTLLATLTSFTDGHWAVTDAHGRFDASNGGDNPHLHWVFENTPIDLGQLKDRYYDPGLLQKVMGYAKEPLRTVPDFEDALLHKWPEVAVGSDPKKPLRVAISLTDLGDGYGRVRVRLNGKELTADAAAGKTLSGKTASLSVDLDPERLLPGDNRIDVVAWPKVGHIPSPVSQLIVSGATARGATRTAGSPTGAAKPVTLHAIVMGVSQYAGASLRLAFSGKDAVDFAQTLELGGARLFGADRVRVHRFSDYTAESGKAAPAVPVERSPTRDNLKRAFDTVAREARVGDILLVYLAGHGVMTPGAAGEAEYYYLSREARSTDLSDQAIRKLWGTSSSELTDWIKRVKATKQVLVLDTCAAGGAIDKLVAKRQIPGAQLIALEQLKDRTGVHILAGAAADKVSFEASQYGQGLLTYALLSGMKGAALKDEIIDVQKLFQYTRDEVPKLARQIGGIQEPRLSSPQGESFAIGRMAEEDRKKVPLAQIKPMIQRASFQDEARMMDVLKLGKRFDDRLKLETYAAARGTLIYVDADDFPEAWQVSGRYRKEGNGVKLMARLFQGEAEKAAFDVLLPLEEDKQADALLAAVIKAMGKGL